MKMPHRKKPPAKASKPLQFESLAQVLKGWFDKSLAELPNEQVERVKSDFPPLCWDSWTKDFRQRWAERWDANHDPLKPSDPVERIYPERYSTDPSDRDPAVKTLDRLDEERDAIQQRIDREDDPASLEILRARLAELEEQRRGLRGDHHPVASPIEVSPQKRSRLDLMAIEIENAIRELGGTDDRRKIMAQLQSYAGRDGTCILEVVPGGVKWCDSNDREKTLDRENLRKRLEHRARAGK